MLFSIAVALPLLQAVLAVPTPEAAAAPSGLDAMMKAKGKKYFGTCSDRGKLAITKNAETIIADFGALTPENSMKWESVERQRGSYSFADGDFLVKWATDHNMTIRGHTTLWHSQLPQWVKNINDKTTLRNVIETHVTTVMKRWAGKIYAWDVINEMFEENGQLRNSVFSNVFKENGKPGDGFVKIAFDAARKADPNAKLYINDYNLDLPMNPKTSAMASHVERWIAQGIPIDGIGSQAHIQRGQGAQAKAALAKLCGVAGLKECAVTEADVPQGSPTDFAGLVSACVGNEKCVGVTVWGVRDQDSWHPLTYPLIWDNDWTPKPAYKAIQQALA
ncbi:endo-1,4-beta-xylanase-like protein [Microthyrium microscopicum]|uniref:Beta-xylanase n=1 Tax=Microthyrium microscopicum TaxID=703497 RepID=A0A6A6TVT4_9PEZI|nr:endo-1,4-beta-xylanase-like protein [Microthyrium microscopicum]